MSYRLTSLAWEVTLPTTPKIVLLAIADRANEKTGDCFPSINDISHRTGLSDRSVQRAINSLVRDGFITRVQRRQTTPLYTVNIPAATRKTRHSVTSYKTRQCVGS